MPNLALFDFDGTVTVSDTFTPFIFYAVDSTRIRLGQVMLSPLILAYKLGFVHPSLVRTRILRFGFRGKNEMEVRRMGERYSREWLPKVVRPEALERIQWHKAQGDTVVVVSASLDVYLSDWCREHRLELICTELESHGGVLTGKYRIRDCAGREKARRVRERCNVENYGVVYAYGDTTEDAEMPASYEITVKHQVGIAFDDLLAMQTAIEAFLLIFTKSQDS